MAHDEHSLEILSGMLRCELARDMYIIQRPEPHGLLPLFLLRLVCLSLNIFIFLFLLLRRFASDLRLLHAFGHLYLYLTKTTRAVFSVPLSLLSHSTRILFTVVSSAKASSCIFLHFAATIKI